jgi:adenine-specific DNA-methyltransferase
MTSLSSRHARIGLAVDPGKPDAVADGYFSLHMRRYLGCKTRLLPRIAEVLAAACPDIGSVFDVFAGTGVVADLLNTPERRVVVNDFLASNFAILRAWFGAREEDRRAIEETIHALRAVEGDSAYYRENYGGRFFAAETAARIGAIRDAIDRLELRPVVKDAAIASLIYAADAVALTCGHFDAYRGLKDRARPFGLRLPAIRYESNCRNEVYAADGNALARSIEADLVYVDPPYNRRQYGTLYHVLENIARNEKPPLAGKTRKLDPRLRPASAYSTARAAAAFEDLVMHCRGRYILVSYNNMSSGGSSSNALIARSAIEEILSRRGEVTTHRFPFPSFTARRKLLEEHAEYLFLCRVTKRPLRD